MVNLLWSSDLEHLDGLTSIEKDWLSNSQSLTQRLISLSGQKFFVELIGEQWAHVRQDEYEYFQGEKNDFYWVREVFLQSEKERWVYARSITNTLKDKNSSCDLSQLGKQPLGSLFFSNLNFKRSRFSYAFYPAIDIPLSCRKNKLKARRSSFKFSNLCVLVQEIFLPEFWQKLKL